jgi:hypothetical protein
MVGELITLPLRVTGAAVRLWWRAADEALSVASGAAGFLIDRVSPVESRVPESTPRPEATEAPSMRPVPAPAPLRAPRPAEPPKETRPAEPTEEAPRAPEQPMHVSAEPTLVAETAEPGAEDGAGPEIHIREPWEGYRDMSAREITARLADASAAELAAVELYESSNRGRQTILAAVARQMKGHSPQLTGANGSGSQR